MKSTLPTALRPILLALVVTTLVVSEITLFAENTKNAENTENTENQAMFGNTHSRNMISDETGLPATFDIKAGETVALVGESGSGKTVSALSILKLLPYPAASHPSGIIKFRDQSILDLDQNGKHEEYGHRGN